MRCCSSRRRRALNQLDSPTKLDAWPFIVIIGLMVVFDLWLLELAGTPEPFIADVLRLGTAALMIWQQFRTKDIIQDHLTFPGTMPSGILADSTRLSGFLTFFFGPFYLQYALNERVLRDPART